MDLDYPSEADEMDGTRAVQSERHLNRLDVNIITTKRRATKR